MSGYNQIIMPLTLLAISILPGCLTLSGPYVLTAMDASGENLTGEDKVMVEGSGIYTARTVMCINYPGAIVKIIDITTGKELRSKTPYKCPN